MKPTTSLPRQVLVAIAVAVGFFGSVCTFADSVNSPNITLNVDQNRATATGNGAGNISVAINTITLAEISLPEYSAGGDNRIILGVRPGFQFDPTSNVTAQSATFGINGGALNGVATLTPTGVANEQLTFNLTSAAANSTSVQDIIRINGVRVRILSAAGAAGPAQTTMFIKTSTAGGAFAGQGIAAANITRGAPDRLVFSVQPGNTQAGADLLPAVRVADFGGNTILNDDRTITLEVQSNPGSATLLGNAQRLTTNGVATWADADDLRITTAFAGYTLRASHSGAAFLTSDVVESEPFAILSGAPGSLEFSLQPGNTGAGDDILIAVAARDEFGNLASAPVDVTLDAAVNPLGWPLIVDSSLTKTTVGGVAEWTAADNLRINKAVAGYRLAASGLGAPVFSDLFAITAGPPVALRFVQEPTDTQQGLSIDPPVSVEVIDALANRADSEASVQLRLVGSACGGSLTGNAVAAVEGLALFPTLRVDTPCDNLVLLAESSGLIGTVSEGFDVEGGPQVATRLLFSNPPDDTAAGDPILVEVTVLDQFGRPFTAANVGITLSLSSNPTAADLLVDSTLTKQTTAGVATWNAADGLSINEAAEGYQLTASGVGMPVASDPFGISAASPDQVRFVQQPSDTDVGRVVAPPVTVEVLDAFDNPVENGTIVSLQLADSSCDAQLSNGTAPTKDGIANFPGLLLSEACANVRLQANVTGTPAVVSEEFDVFAEDDGAPPACGACGAGGAFAFAPLMLAWAVAKLPRRARNRRA